MSSGFASESSIAEDVQVSELTATLIDAASESSDAYLLADKTKEGRRFQSNFCDFWARLIVVIEERGLLLDASVELLLGWIITISG